MQKKFFLIYLAIFVSLVTIMSLSRRTSDKVRGESVAILAPFWQKILSLKYFVSHPAQPSPWNHFSVEEDKQQLQLENQLLEIEIAYLYEQLLEQQLLSSQISQIASFMPEETKSLTAEYQKGLQNAFQTVQRRVYGLPARVIFRSFDTWNTFLWINIGESANQNLHKPVVAHNSPVVVGKAVVGILDYVGEHQSRVQLVTDNRLALSVRAERGGEQDFLLNEQIEKLLFQMGYKKNLPLASEEQTRLFQLLKQLKQNLQPFRKTWRLAKGKLLGSIYSARPGHDIRLKGAGFNYDFSDEEGGRRDLRSGKLSRNPHAEAMPLLKVDDLLITTGMDGLFPPGFQVAAVTQVGTLKEGDYYYDLEARPLSGSLEELSLVFVLPPNTTESDNRP